MPSLLQQSTISVTSKTIIRNQAPRSGTLKNALWLAALPAAVLLASCATAPVTSQPSLPPLAAVQSTRPTILPPRPVAVQTAHDTTTTLQEIDDHYAKRDADTRRLLQQALEGMKQAASSADLQAVKSNTSQIESRLAGATAASERTATLLTSLMARVQAIETLIANTEKQKEKAGQQQDKQSAAFDADSQLTDALRALQAPAYVTEPIRRWLSEHQEHPKRPEAMFQLALAYFEQRYPSAAALYLERVINSYPTDPLASEARALLATIRPSPTVPVRTLAKKPVKRAATAQAKITKPPIDPTPTDEESTPKGEDRRPARDEERIPKGEGRPLPDHTSKNTIQPCDDECRKTLRSSPFDSTNTDPVATRNIQPRKNSAKTTLRMDADNEIDDEPAVANPKDRQQTPPFSVPFKSTTTNAKSKN